MRLRTLEVEGYRSISGLVTLPIDPDVTVLLGANDHGKTNILNALRHLNSDQRFDAEADLNWDRQAEPEKFPFVAFEFELDTNERAEILDSVNMELEREYRSLYSTSASPTTEATAVAVLEAVDAPAIPEL